MKLSKSKIAPAAMLFICATLPLSGWCANSDSLAKTSISIESANADATLDRTLARPKEVFRRYVPALDANSTMVSPLAVSGTQINPIIQMTARSCVLIICEQVTVDGYLSVREVEGKCDRNFALETDLSRSSRLLTDSYRRLDADICYTRIDKGSATLKITATALRAPGFSGGYLQRAVLKLLRLQVKPISDALNATLKANK